MFRYGDYQFRVATTDVLIRGAQELRYRVYVDECGFENASAHPDGREHDAYDPHAVALVALDPEGRVVGTTRLVLNSPNQGLPIFHALRRFEGFHHRSTRIAEVSRLAVDPRFRVKEVVGATGPRRFQTSSAEGLPSRDRRAQSLVTTGLFHLLVLASIRLGLKQWLMITEKKLWVMLKRMGIVFHPIGEEVEYHGKRTPYLADLSHVDQAILRTHAATLAQCPPAIERAHVVPSNFSETVAA
jgi:N-acyl amino acid synthase of PEP-CTERM/exosortase system